MVHKIELVKKSDVKEGVRKIDEKFKKIDFKDLKFKFKKKK